ncbi:hypothetical protein [Halomonas caseinilytica]|uniref:hypothetical protein n=1 Tax=Halomonas caseinilytica TaxID=438744 RepID=UPI000848525D|nr:hypothetical protein [Halomonas caseinilytica]
MYLIPLETLPANVQTPLIPPVWGGDVKIPAGDSAQAMSYHQAGSAEATSLQAARVLVVHELLYQRYDELGWDIKEATLLAIAQVGAGAPWTVPCSAWPKAARPPVGLALWLTRGQRQSSRRGRALLYTEASKHCPCERAGCEPRPASLPEARLGVSSVSLDDGSTDTLMQ